MIYGVSGGPIDPKLPYAPIIQARCDLHNCSSPLAYAIAYRETIRGEIGGQWNAAKVMSQNGDGGHGLFQLTSSWPEPGWDDPTINTDWAVLHYIRPALDLYASRGMRGEALVRIVAAAFNAGPGAAWRAHLNGDVDRATTGHDYADDVLRQYHRLVNHQKPN